MNPDSLVGPLLLVLGVLLNGVYALGLKPANARCRSIAELELFNGFFSLTAFVGALISALIQGESLRIPGSGLAASALFGVIFSVCVFTNLKALEEGPLSLTALIINFSLVMPLVYSFCFLNEPITFLRIIGILILFVCMFLFTNPKITGEKKTSGKWLVLTLVSTVSNGVLAIIAKAYALQTENAYASQFLVCSYLFATVTSFLLFAALHTKLPKENRVIPKQFFTPMMIFLIVLIGTANFVLNLTAVLLATMMDASVVYPVLQSGGPMVTIIGSRLLFGEHISLKKGLAILLGLAAIVLLNL